MTYPKSEVDECERLVAQGAAMRMDAIRTQIKTVGTFCDLAEYELQRQAPLEAQTILKKVHREMSKIDHHLREPGGVSRDAVEELRERAARAGTRVQKIAASVSAMPSCTAG